MSDPFGDRPFPRGPLIGAGLLIVASIAAVAAVRTTGEGTLDTPRASVLAERELTFTDRVDGGIDVIDAKDNRRIDLLAPGADNFMRATLRGLVRERRSRGLGADTPFRLTARTDGRLTLDDPATGRLIDLAAFGPTNAGAFARLLAPPRTTAAVTAR